MSATQITTRRVLAMRATFDRFANNVAKAERQLLAQIDGHDGFPSSAPMNGSDGIGRSSGPATSTVERAALGERIQQSSLLATLLADFAALEQILARGDVAVLAALPPVAPPVTCNGGLGREGAAEWAGELPCHKVAARNGLCDMHRMRERRYRADNGLEAREDTQ